MTRLLDGVFSEGFETLVKLTRDPDFTVELASKIRGKDGAKRALKALHREFFPELELKPEPKVEPLRSLIADGDADPFVPEGWTVESHKKCGKVDVAKIGLYLADAQKTGIVKGTELEKLLEGQPVLNACVLDAWLANPHLIPDSLKGQIIFFWGTKYRDSGGSRVVRCLYWSGDQWRWDYHWIGDGFDGRRPAAILAA